MKTNIKIFALLLAFSILLGVVPTVFAEELPSAIIDENFDNMTRNQEPDGWVVEPIGRNDAGVMVTASPNSIQGGNAMRIEDNSTEFEKPALACKTFAPMADIALSFDYYLESVKGANAFALASGGSSTRQKRVNIATFDNGDETATLKYFDTAQYKWIATPKTDMQKGTWYSFKIITNANSGSADLYLDGTKLCEIWADQSILTVDRVLFHTNNKASINDVFYIDNVKVAKAVSSVTDYAIEACESGKFGFTATLSNVSDFEFALMSNNTYAFSISANEDGTLCYRRDNLWIPFSAAGAVRANQELKIAIDLPPARNVDYARVYVNDVYVGMAIYTNKFTTITALRFESGETFRVCDIWTGDSDGITQMPARTESQPVVYVPEVIPSTSLIRRLDYEPQIGVMYPDDGDVYLDTRVTSVGVDLGYKQKVNAIRLYDGDNEISPRANHFTVWQSDDNQNWKEISGFLFNRITEDNKCQILIEFSGVEARYIKVNYTDFDGESSIYLTNLATCIRAERYITRQWQLAATPMLAQNDLSPNSTSMAQVLKQEPLTVVKGDSIGLWFGIHSAVEAIEVQADGIDALGKDAFALYYSNDNVTYTQIENTTLSLGDGTWRLTFDSIQCGYLKLYAIADVSISLASLADGIRAYSSQEVLTGHIMQSTDRGADGDFYAMPDGTLVAAYNGFSSQVGSSGGGDASDASLNFFTSTDGGYTWSAGESFLLKSEGSLNVLNPTYIWLANGELGLIYCEKEEAEICNIYIRRSTDYGATWGGAQRITDAPQGYTILPSGHRVLRLSSGRILLPVAYSVTVNDVYGSDRAIGYVWYSDDEGYTWHRSTDALTLPHAALEPSVAELSNGNILLSLRTREERVIYQSISTDGGLTWAQPVKTDIQSPSATNTVMTLPATGDIALFWNNDFSASGSERRPLTVILSSDDGLTYHNIRSLVDCDYPTPWPSVAFYGRSVFLMHGNETHVRVFDIATLYQTTSGKTTTADLPLAATPTAVLDEESGWLTGLSDTMQYSLDGGKTWVFAGGNRVLLNLETVSANEIFIKDIGTAQTAPSNAQSIPLARKDTEQQTPETPTTPDIPENPTVQDKQTTNSIGKIAAIAIGCALAVGLITFIIIKRKKG